MRFESARAVAFGHGGTGLGLDQRLFYERPQWMGIALRFADGAVISYEADRVLRFQVSTEERDDRLLNGFGVPDRILYVPREFTFEMTTDQFTMRHFRDWNADGNPPARQPGELDVARPRALERGGEAR